MWFFASAVDEIVVKTSKSIVPVQTKSELNDRKRDESSEAGFQFNLSNQFKERRYRKAQEFVSNDLTQLGGHSSCRYFGEKKGGCPCHRHLPMCVSSGSKWWNWYEQGARLET